MLLANEERTEALRRINDDVFRKKGAKVIYRHLERDQMENGEYQTGEGDSLYELICNGTEYIIFVLDLDTEEVFVYAHMFTWDAAYAEWWGIILGDDWKERSYGGGEAA